MAARKQRINWSPEAEADLTDIWNYYREVAGALVAAAQVRAIANSCRMLEEHALSGRRRDEVRPGLRSVLASPHVIFYRLVGDVPQIVRVLDGRRDIEDIFADS